ncbi:beta-ketoacyl-[acyl-carrier-protein] synthase family protein [Desulfovibrio litoralis]|uniref:3-oxoacyl-[acyl-carrier-protein] synthase 1 n=1 Tax=Desulfovibrio litoralis DSM 11393 TaxID=1121455 RepID=A0A1M7STT9_9BACT|nr:beta-ketoacyl-[acyl-carrier-protein] synthase family protein [Desulfovibrio litoralis]SHN61786.1 3-oxoacyl-[acyl-carrier-protein] synthase-1 [Desulfovibrio litoralis DSM 11393]
MSYRVVITGIGAVSTLGHNCDEITQALFNGHSGIGIDLDRKSLGFLSPLTGIIKPFTPKYNLQRKQKKTMPDFAQWAYEAVMQALEMSEIALEDLENPQSGIIFGSDSSALAAIVQTDKLLHSKNTTSIGSGLVFQSMTSCISMNLNTLLRTQGACWTISAACSSSGHAVGQAADLIALGKQERVICGGAQEINWQSMCSFDGIGAFSQHVQQPEKASRPFDSKRDGLVPSGGAAAIILERYDAAKKRGAKILGEIIGYGFSSDGENIATPSSSGLGRAMKMALSQGQKSVSDVSYLCAHATSTRVGDAMEATNIKAVFRDTAVPISSLKALTGHELWMSGASQVVYSTLMAKAGFIAANANFIEADKEYSDLNILKENLPYPPKIVLCNAAGFGGTNSSLLIDFNF